MKDLSLPGGLLRLHISKFTHTTLFLLPKFTAVLLPPPLQDHSTPLLHENYCLQELSRF